MREYKEYPFKKFADKFHDGVMNEESYHFYLYFVQGLLYLDTLKQVFALMDNSDYFREVKE